MRRVDMAVLPEEKEDISAQAHVWAKEHKYARAPRNRYGNEVIEHYLDELDLDYPPHSRAQRNRMVDAELAQWEQARAEGRPLPSNDMFGTLRRTPRIGVELDRLEFTVSDRTYLRLRNAARSQGISTSAMLRIIFELMDEEDFE